MDENTDNENSKVKKPTESNLYFNQKQRPENEKIVDSKFLRKIFFVVGIVVILLSIIVSIIQIRKTRLVDGDSYAVNQVVKDDDMQIESETQTNEQERKKEYQYVNLYHKAGEVLTPITTVMDKRSGSSFIAKHANTLIYDGNIIFYDPSTSDDHEKEGINIYRFNIDDGSIKILITTKDIFLDKSVNSIVESEELLLDENDFVNSSDYISQFEIVENTLIVGLGGYRNPGAILAVDLNEENPERKLIVKDFGSVFFKEINSNYFIASAFGDACTAYATYYRLEDLNTYAISPGLYFDSGCGAADRVLDYIDNSLVVLNTVDADENAEDENITGSIAGIASKIILYDFDDNSEILFDFQNVNDQLYSFSYDEIDKKLYLVDTKSLYVYNFNSTNFNKIGDLSETYGSPVSIDRVLPDGGLCIRYSESDNLESVYFTDHTTGKVDVNNTNCVWSESTVGKNLSDVAQEYFDSLNLPDGYTYKIETNPIITGL